LIEKIIFLTSLLHCHYHEYPSKLKAPPRVTMTLSQAELLFHVVTVHLQPSSFLPSVLLPCLLPTVPLFALGNWSQHMPTLSLVLWPTGIVKMLTLS
jgi:hypothetical protein